MHFPRKSSILRIWIVSISWFFEVTSLCVPDVPTSLLSDAAVLNSPVVQDALREVERNLTGQFGGGKFSGGMSFAIVHASTPDKIYTYNKGLLKLNETENPTPITSDSIFRVASISKNIVMLSTLIISNHSISQPNIPLPPLTLSTALTTILPSFHLPPLDWDLNDGRSITLSMLLSQSSGLPREGYETKFDDVRGMSRASAKFIGEMWGGATPQSVVEAVGQQGLIYEVGQRASYSNAGFCLLAYGVVEYWNSMNSLRSSESQSPTPNKEDSKHENLTWTQFATQEVLKPLNMNHSFFGSIPDSLKGEISIPGTPDNWVDLLIGPGYDPAGGMYSSATDLSTYLHRTWLSPTPSLITKTQQNIALKPYITLPDGIQSVGLGWEISLLKSRVSGGKEEGEGYNVFGKSGDAAAQHSRIEVVPNLGYGVVIVSSDGPAPASDISAAKNTSARIQTSPLTAQIHDILIPAFREAYSLKLAERWAGNYTVDGGGNGSFSDMANHALVEVEDNVLYLRHLVYNNVSALLRLDMLGWDPDPAKANANQPVFFGTGKGVSLNPSNLRGAEAGVGVKQAFRMSIQGELCDYFDFDGYTDPSGWGLDMIVFEEGEGKMRLKYPPLGAVLVRKGS